MNNNSNNAKTWYKVWWIWVIIFVAFVIILMFISGNNSSDDEASNNVNSTDTSQSGTSIKSESEDTNDGIKVNGNTLDFKGYETKINKVTYWNGDGDFNTPDKGKQYVIVNVTITNNKGSKEDYNPFDYQLNEDGNETDLDSYIHNDKYEDSDLGTGSLRPGASTTANLIGQAQPGKKLQLVYTPNSFSDESGSIDLN